MLSHIIYMSRAVRPLSDTDLQELLVQCRRDNARLHVTGVLFYSHGNIAQLIEGESEVLEALYAKISQDLRHSNVTKMSDKSISRRSFADWSMAFQPLDPSAFSTLEGFFRPEQLRAVPAGLDAADALLLNLVREAVVNPKS
ncbi:BLUF domain-containing protein [Hymenobacter coalescens]